MKRELVIEQPFYEVEQCPAESVRVYRVCGLHLYDTKEERNAGPVIDLVKGMRGVMWACFKDQHAVIVLRSVRATWQDVEPQILSLIRGVVACSDEFEPRGAAPVLSLVSVRRNKLVA
jgi:hypothetical protein